MPKIVKPGLFRHHVIVTPAQVGETLPEISIELIKSLYQQYGALLFRGFPMDTDVFRQMTSSLCTHAVMNDSPGRKSVDKRLAIQTVDLGDGPFPLHAELAREPWKPDVCFFACLSPPRSGGETTICDGVKLVRKLPRATRAALAGRRLRYTKRATKEELKYWFGFANPRDKALASPPPDCPFSFSKLQGNVLRSFSRPALHRTMFSNELCFGNFLLFARYLHKVRHFPTFDDGTEVPDTVLDKVKQVGDRLTEAIHWQGGDLLLLDNSRFMHGRKAITNTEERYIIAYFGFLNFARPDAEEGPNPRWRQPKIWRRIHSSI